MRWITYTYRGKNAVGRLLTDGSVQPTDAQDLRDIIAGASWKDVGKPVARRDIALQAPYVPTNIICVGLNYVDHADESKMAVPKFPVLFAKFTNSVSPDGGHFSWKPGVSDKIDFEAELGVVIGKAARRVECSKALDYVFGYAATNDVSVRDIQLDEGQWVRGKTFDGACPIGPALVTRDEIADVQALRIGCTVNGKIMQDSNTSKMVFPVDYLISHISQTMTLQPGDLILTGTPHGVGHHRRPPIYLRKGDVVTVLIEKVGELTTYIDGPIG